MSREYTVTTTLVSFANQAVTLCWLAPPSNAAIEILRCWIGQNANATNAQQRVQIGTQVSSYPTLAAGTVTKLKQGDPTSLLSGLVSGQSGVGINATGEGTGTKTVVITDCFNVLNGWLWLPTPPETMILNWGASAGFFLHFPSAPATLSGWSYGVVYRELG